MTKPAALVAADAPIVLASAVAPYVSRGGDKLHGALEHFDVVVEGKRWLDVGASTGGFTDRLLQGGAEAVVALDVGYGQLDWKLRTDDRVTVLERVNARGLRREDLPWAPDGVVADVSFISLTLILPPVAGVAAEDADYILLVKPQFEVTKQDVGRRGVVRDPELWRKAVDRVVAAAAGLGLGIVDATPSPIRGPAGNQEFFVHLRAGVGPDPGAVDAALEDAT